MADIAMLGEYDSVLLAKSVGIDAYGVSDKAEATKLIARLAREGVKVIFITEALYAECSEIVNRYKSLPLPAIIPVPGAKGTDGTAMASIKANVEKAIGVDILSEK